MESLKAVVLMGGQSKRFGSPKGLVRVPVASRSMQESEGSDAVGVQESSRGKGSSRRKAHRMEIPVTSSVQWCRLQDLLASYCDAVLFSMRRAQRETYAAIPEHSIVYDNNILKTPGGTAMTGVLSAHLAFPESALLVVAIDLFFLSETSIAQLVREYRRQELEGGKAKQRPHVIAFFHEVIQPLCAIYTRESFPALLAAHQRQQYSVRRVIENLPRRVLKCRNMDELSNINTKEKLAEASLKAGAQVAQRRHGK